MPIRIEVKTSGVAFPDQGTPRDYLAAVAPVMEQINSVIQEFSRNRIDRKAVLKDAAGQVCGEIEILRF